MSGIFIQEGLYFFGGGGHIIPQSYELSHRLCFNPFLQVWFICNQKNQVPPFRYINWHDEVSILVRGRKVVEDMKYLMRSFKPAAEAVIISSEENWDVKMVNLLYTIIYYDIWEVSFQNK